MADKTTRRPRAETPKGFRDHFGADVVRRKAMLDAIAAVYHRYGFDPLETPAVETVEALGKFLPDVDRPNEGVFAWDEGTAERPDWLALRYDLTAPLARVYAQHRADLPTPYRRYAMGPVWRNEKPGPGRFRQFYQCDADTVGAASVAADAEICAMLCDALEAVGIKRGDYVVRVNNRKVLNGVLEVAGLLDPADPSRFEAERGIVLRAIDKLDRLGVGGVRALLGAGRKDESGDFTKGAGLTEQQSQLVLQFVQANEVVRSNLAGSVGSSPKEADYLRRGAYGQSNQRHPSTQQQDESYGSVWNTSVLGHLREIVGSSQRGAEGVDELSEASTLLEAQGYGPDRIVIDPSTVRGLGYYTGPVYEAELTFPITDETGQPRAFGSVAGGGRYDDLVTRFTGQAVPATGVSIGVDRLLAALDARRADETPAAGPVVVTVMDRARMADYQAICAALRQAGLRAEVYLGNPKSFGNQLRYADRRGSPAAIIQGSDEAARGVVQVKDLVAGARLASQASVEEWRGNPTQAEVAVRGPGGAPDFDPLLRHLRALGVRAPAGT